MALIQELLGLEGGHASVRNAYLGYAQLKLKRSDEAVKAADDKPMRGLLPEHGKASSLMKLGPTCMMLG